MSEFLATHRETAEDLLEEALPFLTDARLSFNGLLQFCENYRIKGTVHLLLEAEAEQLHRNLHRSGRAFLYGLQGIASEKIVASRAVPLFDAMACGDFTTAAEIARRLPTGWRRDVEYEDDHLYVHQVGHWLLGRSPEERRTPMARYEATAAPADARLAVLHALESADELAFSRAVNGLAHSYGNQVRARVAGGKTSAEFADTLPHLCVEALGMIRLAGRVEVHCLTECHLVPELARGDFSAALANADWRRPRDR